MYFHCLVMPQHKHSCPGVHEINNYGRPILGYHYYTLSLSEVCPRVEKMLTNERRTPTHSNRSSESLGLKKLWKHNVIICSPSDCLCCYYIVKCTLCPSIISVLSTRGLHQLLAVLKILVLKRPLIKILHLLNVVWEKKFIVYLFLR